MMKVLQKCTAILLAVLFVCSPLAATPFRFPVFAYDDVESPIIPEVPTVTTGTTGDCTWTLKGTVLTVSGEGAMADYDFSNVAPWGTSVTKVIIGEGVTNIGNRSFLKCSNLDDLTMPDSVTTIGSYAFSYCTALAYVFLPNSVNTVGSYAFSGCSGLMELGLPVGVTTVEGYAFAGCRLLTDVWYNGTTKDQSFITIGSGNGALTSAAWHYAEEEVHTHTYDNACDTDCNECGEVREVPGHVYDGDLDTDCNECGAVREVEHPENPEVPTVLSGTTGDCTWTLKGTVLTVSGEGAMADYDASNPAPWGTSVTKVIIGEGVTNIGSYAFYDCSSLDDLTMPDSVTTVGSYAFSYCTALAYVFLPNSVNTVGSYAFSGCSGLMELGLPVGVTTVEGNAFAGCKLLTDVWYNGTTKDQSFITIGSGNGALTSAAWHYAEEEVHTHTYDNACDTDCNECGEVREVPDHKLTQVLVVSATCTQPSIYQNVCVVCSEKVGEPIRGDIDPTAHLGNISVIPGVAPTCFAEGKTDGKRCADCEAVLDPAQIIPKLPHTYDNACDTDCNECGAAREVPGHVYDGDLDADCNVCGEKRSTGDSVDPDGNGKWDMDDAIYLLFHAIFPDNYPVNGDVDLDGNGQVDLDDAIYALYYVFFPERYPLS